MSQTSTIRSESAQQTLDMGAAIALLARKGDVITLDGELGAGKTQFVRGLAQGLGLNPEQVTSPTFVLVHEYEADDSVLVHIDAYRMSGGEAFDDIGWDDLRHQAIVAIEWARRAESAIGADRLEIFIEHAGGNKRLISFTAHGTWQGRAKQLAVAPCPICKTPSLAAMATNPFCTKRCKQIDLGRWLDEGYRISRPIEQRDIEDGE